MANLSLLAGKIQGILPISPVGSGQMVQNIDRITMDYEKIPCAREQGNFGSHQGIELGNQLLSGKQLSLALVGINLRLLSQTGLCAGDLRRQRRQREQRSLRPVLSFHETFHPAIPQ
jgi:hypothetical protein